ncbi:hypothetical protein [Halobaculum sp. MBLA0143]|uniref:hypothetical protein n=1 Tax=Halobaculum sp. MBLA0143 TaxID=3079933 RepID=UPI0035250A96
MPIRPVDNDVLSDACRSVAEENYGFVYVDREKQAIKDAYESEGSGLVHSGSVSNTDIKQELREMASAEDYPFERIRPGVFYVDPFDKGLDMGVADELQELFDHDLVATAEDFRRQFDLALDDVSFFVEELQDNERGLVLRIAAGARDYYTIGPQLKERVDGRGEDLNDKLASEGMNGRITHENLEDAISVTAVSDVINYLESEGYILDLDGEYLVRDDVDEFARWLWEGIEEEVVTAFQDAGYAMPKTEYRSLLVDQIESYSNVLAAVRSSRPGLDLDQDDIVKHVAEWFESGTGIEETDGRVPIAKHTDEVDAEVAGRAESMVQPVVNKEGAHTASSLKQEVEPEIEELRMASTEPANEYLRDEVRQRVSDLIDEEMNV